MKRDQLKSLLLGAILLAGITLPAKAQIGEQRHNFAIGINGGANYSTVSFHHQAKRSFGNYRRCHSTLHFRKILRYDLWCTIGT